MILNNSILDVLAQTEDSSFDCIITSPPYNVGKDYEKTKSLEDYLKDFKPVLKELKRVLKENGSIAWQVGNFIKDKEVYPLDIYFYPLFKDLGFKLRNRIIWRFGHGLHSKLRFSGRYETILWFSKSDGYTFNLDSVRVPAKYPGKRHFKGAKKGQLSGNPKGKNPADVWEIVLRDWECQVWDIVNVKSNHVEKTAHPCQFPIELVDRLILALSNFGDRILDPFGGVGTTLISALKNGRKALCVEKEELYCQIAQERVLDLFKGKLKCREMSQEIYTPKNDSVACVPEEWRGLGVYWKSLICTPT